MMTFYKDKAGRVHEVEHEFIHLLPEGCEEITEAVAMLLLKPNEADLKLFEIEKAKAALVDLDIRSIRALREYVAAQANAPAQIKAIELEAIAERVKVK